VKRSAGRYDMRAPRGHSRARRPHRWRRGDPRWARRFAMSVHGPRAPRPARPPRRRTLETWKAGDLKSPGQSFRFPDFQLAARSKSFRVLASPRVHSCSSADTLPSASANRSVCTAPTRSVTAAASSPAADARSLNCSWARAQHRLGIAVVADGPQGQAVRVAQSVDRAIDARPE